MTEFCFTESAATNSNKNGKFRPSDLFSSIISQPLYFSYLIFFSTYLFKLLSFLSPLFITTTLLVLISLVITLVHDNRGQGLDLQDGLAKLLWCKVNDDGEEYPPEELVNFEEFEVYRIIFGTTDDESSSDQSSCSGSSSTDETLPNYEVLLGENYSDEELPAEKTIHVVEKPTISLKEGQEGPKVVVVECGKDEDKSEKFIPTKENTEEGQETAATATIDTDSDKMEQVKQESSTISTESLTTENQDTKFEDAVADQEEDQNLSPDDNYHTTETEYTLSKSRSRSSRRLSRRAPCDVDTNNNTGSSTRGSSGGGGSGHYEAFTSPSYLGNSFGSSMRKQKEWRRTLACKLFEERHNNNHVAADQGTGEECMDSLWETTCDNETELKNKNNTSGKKGEIIKKNKKEKKVESLLLEAVMDINDEDEEDDYVEDDNGRNGRLCCLQALKLSAGKMNLGMKRPNLMKITKAFKGMGWLHQHGVSNKKNTRKGYK